MPQILQLSLPYCPKLHFFLLATSLDSLSSCSANLRCSSSALLRWECHKKNAKTYFLVKGFNTSFMRTWGVSGWSISQLEGYDQKFMKPFMFAKKLFYEIFILVWWYLYFRSNFEKMVAPPIPSRSSSIIGIWNLFGIVILFRHVFYTTSILSFFFTQITGPE